MLLGDIYKYLDDRSREQGEFTLTYEWGWRGEAGIAGLNEMRVLPLASSLPALFSAMQRYSPASCLLYRPTKHKFYKVKNFFYFAIYCASHIEKFMM